MFVQYSIVEQVGGYEWPVPFPYVLKLVKGGYRKGLYNWRQL